MYQNVDIRDSMAALRWGLLTVTMYERATSSVTGVLLPDDAALGHATQKCLRAEPCNTLRRDQRVLTSTPRSRPIMAELLDAVEDQV